MTHQDQILIQICTQMTRQRASSACLHFGSLQLRKYGHTICRGILRWTRGRVVADADASAFPESYLSLTFFLLTGKELDSHTGNLISNLPEDISVQYSGRRLESAWAGTPDVASSFERTPQFPRFVGWYSDVDDLNLRWRVALMDWDTEWWRLDPPVDATMFKLFANLASPSHPFFSTDKTRRLPAIHLCRGHKFNWSSAHITRRYIFEFIPLLLPSIWNAFVDSHNRKSMAAAYEMEYTLKLYSCLIDPFSLNVRACERNKLPTCQKEAT